MKTELLQMSGKEIDRLAIIQRLEARELSQLEAAKELSLDPRQVRRLQRNYRVHGAAGLISKRRGRSSNNQLSIECKTQAIDLLKKHYPDFNPAFAHEKLTEVHGLKLSVESVRQLMLSEALWKGKKRKAVVIHQMRSRRCALGEMVQIDGSHHDWFEGRRDKCCLLVFVDDATSRIMHLRFEEQETSDGYCKATQSYLLEHGRPLSFYSDKYGVFRVNHTEALKSTGETQFGRALRELGIKLLCANSPQAKGRVERLNGTLQNRLVKELRLRNISDIATANQYLPEFIKDYNERFAVAPQNPIDAHQQIIPDEKTLKLILSPHHQRTLTKNLELSYNNVIYQIQVETLSYAMRGASITIIDQQEGAILVYKGKQLTYKTRDKNNRPTEITDLKTVSSINQSHLKTSQIQPWLLSPAYFINSSQTVSAS